MKSPSEERQILLIGEILYATAAWRSLSALGRLRVRLGGPDAQQYRLGHTSFPPLQGTTHRESERERERERHADRDKQ